ncbi:MAG: DUF1624 domain-containing protein [Methanomicrobiaceae archaeon]|nr:DUF1624 domain-containing protein [Methanomicrobiaceae archaeon]
MSFPSEKKERFWELDSFRGIAIAMMVLFHILFDISYFGILQINVNYGFWRFFGYLTAVLFVFIAGVSVFISSERSKKYLKGIHFYLKFFKRGMFLLFTGGLITIVTWLVIREGFIVFGILHLIGLSVILSPFFVRFEKFNTLLGIAVIITGIFLTGIKGPYILIPIGITPNTFYSLDYEPLFPWFGFFLIGIAAGSYFYPKAQRNFKNILNYKKYLEFLGFIGRHSLIIYLIHQPVIILILSLLEGRILI